MRSRVLVRAAGKAVRFTKKCESTNARTVQKSSKSAGISTDGAFASSSAVVPEVLRYFFSAIISATYEFHSAREQKKDSTRAKKGEEK